MLISWWRARKLRKRQVQAAREREEKEKKLGHIRAEILALKKEEQPSSVTIEVMEDWQDEIEHELGITPELDEPSPSNMVR